MRQKGFSTVWVIIALIFIIFILSVAIFILVASNMKRADLSLQYITNILIDGFKMPLNSLNYVLAFIEKIKEWFARFSWWTFY